MQLLRLQQAVESTQPLIQRLTGVGGGSFPEDETMVTRNGPLSRNDGVKTGSSWLNLKYCLATCLERLREPTIIALMVENHCTWLIL